MRLRLNPRWRGGWAQKIGLAIVVTFFVIALFADFLAPYDYRDQTRMEPSAPPTALRFTRPDGTFGFRPVVYARKLTDPRSFGYQDDPSRSGDLVLFARGSTYNLLGIFRTDIHLFGVSGEGDDRPRVRILGTDQLGRDRFSRLLYAIRFSLLVSPAGTVLACLIGIFAGAISGYSHRNVDAVMMGVADTMISLPALILILAARAAFPLELPPFTAAVLLIVIFALTGWAEMARLTRGLVVAIKDREFILASRAIGLTETRILTRHVLPNIASPLFVQATLLLPVFLLAEITLSFLGVGLQEPEPSLGNMLSAASDVTLIRRSPFLTLSPAAAIFLFVLGIRLLAMRRADPDGR